MTDCRHNYPVRIDLVATLEFDADGNVVPGERPCDQVDSCSNCGHIYCWSSGKAAA